MDEGDEILYGIDVPARNIPELAIASFTLINKFREEEKASESHETKEDIDSLIFNHIDSYVKKNPLPTISFKGIDLEWFNVSKPLSFEEDLESHIVVLDFFTYCCINCLHILPDLEALEDKYKPNDSPVIVIGIHSAKFDNERLTKNVSDAIKKNHITHPVANDTSCKLWHYLGISCWPTLLIVGPGGFPLFVLMGEGNKQMLFKCVEESIKYFSKLRKLERKSLPWVPHLHVPSASSDLYYPGKVGTFPDGLIITDTGNHRIILTDFDGVVQNVIGCGRKGFRDGCFESASFSNPQGAVFHPSGAIFVADTDNHAIRKLNLKDGTVETLAGTGLQGRDTEGGQLYTHQAISSPWDVCLGYSKDSDRSEHPNLLFIAMAGLHQIWGLFLTDGEWLKKSFYQKGSVVPLAGSGLEENRNTAYPLKAGFAQPSGLALYETPEGDFVIIADSESSSIRQFSCVDGSVKKVAGGGVDPKDLFAYGDQDGTSNLTRFQHPLGVAACQDRIYVADSYNHKIKLLRKQHKTFISETLSTENLGEKLNEPGGICLSSDGKRLYIADTNNFCIKEYSIDEKKIREITLKLASSDSSQPKDTPDSKEVLTYYIPSKNVKVNVVLNVVLPPNVHLNLEAKNKFYLQCSGTIETGSLEGVIENETLIPLEVDLSQDERADVILLTRLYLCLNEGVCTVQEASRKISFLKNEKESKEEFTCKVELKPQI